MDMSRAVPSCHATTGLAYTEWMQGWTGQWQLQDHISRLAVTAECMCRVSAPKEHILAFCLV
jgi:hypothetical protein